jgi:hypothetical protein
MKSYPREGGCMMAEKKTSEDSPEQKGKERASGDIEPQRDPDKPGHTENQKNNKE